MHRGPGNRSGVRAGERSGEGGGEPFAIAAGRGEVSSWCGALAEPASEQKKKVFPHDVASHQLCLTHCKEARAN
jgi:hypothetical protein